MNKKTAIIIIIGVCLMAFVLAYLLRPYSALGGDPISALIMSY